MKPYVAAASGIIIFPLVSVTYESHEPWQRNRGTGAGSFTWERFAFKRQQHDRIEATA